MEARGFNYGVVKTKVSQRSWTHWYQCPYIDYINDTPDAPPISHEESLDPKNPESEAYNVRLLLYRKGIKMLRGEDVKAVQARLIELGYQPGKADGTYGPITEAAVKAFQANAQIEADGIVGPVTRAAMQK